MSYDLLNRPITVTFADYSVISYTFDSVNRMTRMTEHATQPAHVRRAA